MKSSTVYTENLPRRQFSHDTDLYYFKWEDNTAYNFIFLQIVANLVGIFKQIIFGQVVKVNIEWKRSLRGKNKVKHPAQIGCV